MLMRRRKKAVTPPSPGSNTPEKKPKKPKVWNLDSQIRAALRHVWRSSPEYKQAQAAARVERGRYKCAECGLLFGPKEISVDHIEGAGSVADLQAFRKRLFCPVEGLQILCRYGCHKKKTAQETAARTLMRRAIKAARTASE